MSGTVRILATDYNTNLTKLFSHCVFGENPDGKTKFKFISLDSLLPMAKGQTWQLQTTTGTQDQTVTIKNIKKEEMVQLDVDNSIVGWIPTEVEVEFDEDHSLKTVFFEKVDRENAQPEISSLTPNAVLSEVKNVVEDTKIPADAEAIQTGLNPSEKQYLHTLAEIVRSLVPSAKQYKDEVIILWLFTALGGITALSAVSAIHGFKKEKTPVELIKKIVPILIAAYSAYSGSKILQQKFNVKSDTKSKANTIVNDLFTKIGQSQRVDSVVGSPFFDMPSKGVLF